MAKLTIKEIVAETALHGALANAPKYQVEEIVRGIFEQITTAVENGNEVYLGTNFGGFKPATQAARTAPIPGTDKTVDVPAKQVIKFRPSAALKARIAG